MRGIDHERHGKHERGRERLIEDNSPYRVQGDFRRGRADGTLGWRMGFCHKDHIEHRTEADGSYSANENRKEAASRDVPATMGCLLRVGMSVPAHPLTVGLGGQLNATKTLGGRIFSRRDAKPPRKEEDGELTKITKSTEGWGRWGIVTTKSTNYTELKGFLTSPDGLTPFACGSGHIRLSFASATYWMRRICCFAPAKRMWPEGLIASHASDVRKSFYHRAMEDALW